MPRPQKAAIYCRLSYAPDGSLEKVEQQEADCRDLAMRLANDPPLTDEQITRLVALHSPYLRPKDAVA